ncbi:hypothetical protein MVEG_04259 [Podila verticillata NRRL 6337]|nr:hypothetical protein MVEG_04259 [Podila verticillata NRRL 6337]
MDPQVELSDWATKAQKDPRVLIRELQGDIIASSRITDPAFGKKKSIYTDFFASSKPLRRFESIMMDKVLPFYANTHTSTTSTSKSTSSSVKRARETVARCTNAITTEGHEHQAAVIFSGDGSTSAINKIRNVFRLSDEAYWIRRIPANNSASQESLKLASTVQYLNVPSSLSPSSQRPSSTKSSSSTTTPASSGHRVPEAHRPVVFISIQEHHSNLLPWRESCADIVVVPENGVSQLDLVFLEEQLILHQHRPLKLGSFSAGSNLTGVLNDTIAISELLHKYGAFAFYDYAGVGPYTAIDMNPPPSDPATSNSKNLAYKDGVFISTHKFLGGPGASGLLVARLEVFSWTEQHRGGGGRSSPGSFQSSSVVSSRRSSVSDSPSILSSTSIPLPEDGWVDAEDKSEWLPTNPGGGTVDMVIQGRHKYTNNVLAREEAGTPNILATIRTGLVFTLQEIVRPSFVIQEEYRLAKKVLARLLDPALNGAINVLGNPELDRVAVFSLTISVPRALGAVGGGPDLDGSKPRLQIHYALLSTIMNDFFGVEMRGGCMCAGPYASQLLKFDAEKEIKFWNLLLGENPAEIAKQHFNDEGDNSSSEDHGHGSTNNKSSIHEQDLCSKSLKPGFVRFSFSYFAKDNDVDFVIQSLQWVATYGYLLVPLYKVNARTGEWTVRPAVQKAVLAEVAPRRLFMALHDNCIPVAVDCIRALAGLFREQVAPGSTTTVKMSLGSAFRSAFSKTSVSSVASEPEIELSGLLDGKAESAGSYNHGIIGNSVSSPEVVVDNGSSEEYAENEDGEEEEDDDSEDLPSASNSSSFSPPPPPPPSTSPTIRFPRTRKIHLFTAVKQFRGTDPNTVPDALEELSWSKLKQELDSIESSELAKELRWFITPLEVARVYEREVLAAQASGYSSTVFPR